MEWILGLEGLISRALLIRCIDGALTDWWSMKNHSRLAKKRLAVRNLSEAEEVTALIKKNCFQVILFTLIFLSGAVFASGSSQDQLNALFGNQPEFLDVDQAFQMDFMQSGDEIKITWTIAPEYYLYRDKTKFKGKNAEVGKATFPEGKEVIDEYFGKTIVYYDKLELNIPIEWAKEDATLKIRYQGCAEAGLCYPPKTQEIPLQKVLAEAASAPMNIEKPAAGESIPIQTPGPASEADFTQQFYDNNFFMILVISFGAGLLLAFTPCVFPMYPILTSIIAGQGEKLTTGRAFTLSFIYVQGMALTYALLGLAVAFFGAHLVAYFQHPFVLIGLSLLFVLLALSMFGMYELSMPASWQTKLNSLSQKQSGGTALGVFAMGVISGLVASPCTTAPLAGALAYVAQTGDLLIGFFSLYALSLGMGLPLLILGSSGGKILPRAGDWMNSVKHFFGLVMLVVPILLLSRLVSEETVVLMSVALAFAACAFLYHTHHKIGSSRAKTVLGLGANSLLIASFLTLNHWFFTPEPVVVTQSAQASTTFMTVKTGAELDAQIAAAKAEGRPIMIDFYADWCVACKEFEHITFTDQSVKERLRQFKLIQIDVTKNSMEDMALMKRFEIFGLPALIFIHDGEVMKQRRVSGFMKPEPFSAHLDRVLKQI